MPVILNQPLPDGSPFKGVCIFVGVKWPTPVLPATTPIPAAPSTPRPVVCRQCERTLAHTWDDEDDPTETGERPVTVFQIVEDCHASGPSGSGGAYYIERHRDHYNLVGSESGLLAAAAPTPVDALCREGLTELGADFTEITSTLAREAFAQVLRCLLFENIGTLIVNGRAITPITRAQVLATYRPRKRIMGR